MTSEDAQRRNERTQRTRDLVWDMRRKVGEGQVRVSEVTSYLGDLEERCSSLRSRVVAPESTPALEEALAELENTREEIRVVGEEMERRGEQLHDWAAEAAAKLRFHRRLMEAAPMAFFLTDENGMIAEANEEAGKMLHVPPSYLRNKPLVNFVSRRDVGDARSFVRAVGRSEVIIEGVMVFRPRRGGPVKATRVRACALAGSGERALGWLMQDIPMDAAPSSGGAVNGDRSSSTSPPSSSPEGEALAAVSHELRGPIQTIQTALTLLRTTLPPGCEEGRATSYFDSIQRANNAMTRLVKDLEDSSKVDAGAFSVQRERVDLRGLVEELLAASQPRADKLGVTLGATFPHEAVIVDGDPMRLTQILGNFVDNALKFTSAGKSVRLVLDVHRELARVDVIDEGRGIPPEDLTHVFERRWQAQVTSSLGSGLGLWIARAIGEAHGGTVGVISTPGVGSRFWLELPIREESA